MGSGDAQASPDGTPTSLSSLILRLVGLGFVNAITIFLVFSMVADGIYPLAIVLGIVTIALDIIFLAPGLVPLRWIAPGMALMVIMVVYPILFTIYIAFTNYGDGHLLTEQQVLEQFQSKYFLPENAVVYDYLAYKNAAGEYLLWLSDPDGSGSLIVRPGQVPEDATGEAPAEIDGYQQIPRNRLLVELNTLTTVQFGVAPEEFRTTPRVGKAAQLQPQYTYENGVLTDLQTGKTYTPVRGTFTAEDTEALNPGFAVPIGAGNFTRLFSDPALRGPFLLVFAWTVAFAFFSVLLTFSLGLFLAIMFNVPEMPARNLLRSLLLIPYTIPAFVSVPVWVGLLNPQFGVISQTMISWFGWAPPWFSDPIWAKVGILLIQTWLGFPYMFIIVTGALQSLPTDVYEAAEIDGATPWHAFWTITMPLLLITVGPLLVGSFAFNFNNFTLIELYSRGGPPMANTASAVGHTDILVTYTYRVAFASGRGADLGYASAITVIIFLILVTITMVQFRYTNMLEERSENV